MSPPLFTVSGCGWSCCSGCCWLLSMLLLSPGPEPPSKDLLLRAMDVSLPDIRPPLDGDVLPEFPLTRSRFPVSSELKICT